MKQQQTIYLHNYTTILLRIYIDRFLHNIYRNVYIKHFIFRLVFFSFLTIDAIGTCTKATMRVKQQ